MSEAAERFSEELRNRIDTSKTAGMTATYQFVMADEPEGKVYTKIVSGNIEVAQGEAPQSDIVLTASAQDWHSMLHGDLNGQMAFLTGKLKIRGDMGLAMKLQSVFRFA
jgi:putative sterol carrier protein